MTRLGLALGVVLTALLLVAHSLAAPTKRFANSCSLATATRLVDQNHLNAFLLPNPIAQVLCGPFTGSGSQAMAVTIAAPTCWSPRRWAVFSFAGNAWQLVFQQAGFIFPPVVAVGHDIRVETAVFLPSDKARCLPNGGSQARLWHWNGRTFIPGAPTQVKPATPPRLLEAHFYSPGRQVGCDMIDNPAPHQNPPGVFCSFDPGGVHTTVGFGTTGRVYVCRTSHPGAGDCLGSGGIGGKVLGYGGQVTVGRFRCLVSQAGVKCLVTATGKGFLINATSVKSVGP